MRFTRLFCLLLAAAAIAPLGEVMASVGPPPDPGDQTRTYTFDDLGVSCGYFATTTGLYEDLVFPSPAYLARCNTQNGTVGLTPSQLVGGRLEIRVQLAAPASAVSIQSYLYGTGDDPTLIGYDANGVEVGRASHSTVRVWEVLEVRANAESPIVEIGLLMPQLVGYLDNLTVTYGGGDPEPDPEPEPEVALEPVTRADCIDGAWADFGFRNQGQCVRFVMNGTDSR